MAENQPRHGDFMYPRHLTNRLLEASEDTPVILLLGARQTGKSTLLKSFAGDCIPDLHMANLDDMTTLAALRSSPQGYLRNIPGPLFIDEIQRAPEIFVVLKQLVDEHRTPGKFFLTGSANVLMLPKLSDSLAGRMEIHYLWPLSQGELRGTQERFIEKAFSQESFGKTSTLSQRELIEMITRGGYPEALKRQSPHRRKSWFDSYLTTILQRDVKELSSIEGITALPSLLSLLATRIGGLLNTAELTRSIGIPNSTLKRYLSLLQGVFLTVFLPPWAKNKGKSLTKAPKVYLNDTGLTCALIGIDAHVLEKDRTLFGKLFESFVFMELMKQSAWNVPDTKLYHYRTHEGQEVDILLESADGRCVGIEIKSASHVTNENFKGLRAFQENHPLYKGIVLYTGTEIVYFADNLMALPVSVLWENWPLSLTHQANSSLADAEGFTLKIPPL